MVKHLPLAESGLLFLLTFSLFIGCNNKGDSPSIRVRVKNKAAPFAIILKHYDGNSFIKIDSLIAEKNGEVAFRIDSALVPGMYSIGVNGKDKAEFFISNREPQPFSVTFSEDRSLETLVFKGSTENDEFAGYLSLMETARKKFGALQSGMQQYYRNPDSVQAIQKAVRKIQEEVGEKSASLETRFPGSMLALYLKTARDPEIPEPDIPLMMVNREQVLQAYYYNQMVAHYFDNLDFSNKRLLKLPVLKQKIRYYFTQLVVPQSDSVVARMDTLLGKALFNPEVYVWATRYLYNLFRESPVPEHSGIPVYLAEKYILPKSDVFHDSVYISKVRNRVEKAKLNPVGSPATNLILQTPEGNRTDLYSVKSRFTVLYFYNPGCEACHAVTDQLISIYHRYKERGLEVFAVYVDRNREEWLKYLAPKKPGWINVYDPAGEEAVDQKYDISAIPMIYLLDKDKKVVLKDVPVEGLESYLKQNMGK